LEKKFREMKCKSSSLTAWREKFEKPAEPRIVKIPQKMARLGGTTMLIPTPRLIDELVRQVPKGKVVTVRELRRKLAADFSVDVTCPLTTGIFVRIVAETAEEDRANGRRRLTPYWRIVKEDGGLNPKYPGGVEQQAELLRGERFVVAANSKHQPKLQGFAGRLYKFK
jgi:alkylated DNA nucleotide flippase Atl1